MNTISYVLLAITACGQLAISIAVVNRLHSLGYPRWMLKIGDAICYLLTAGLPIALGLWMLQNQDAVSTISAVNAFRFHPAAAAYLLICCLSVVVFVVDRIHQRTKITTTPRLFSNHTRIVDVTRELGHRPTQQAFTRFCSQLPLNEILQISVHEKQLRLPRLDPGLNGLRITHLSDLHMTGQLTQSFYEEIVRQTNLVESDLIAVTGDIVEKVACLDWISNTLGKLRARHGVFFVLGNHELRIPDESLVRRTLTDAGLIDLGSRWELVTHNGLPIVLGGNELPWYQPAVDFGTSPAEIDGQRPFRILLSHSPDQLGWARTHDCDMLLAGHTHGGQVRLPLIGPVLSPSRNGSRFASGTFFYEPTLMHVSRGLSGTRPLRLNCRPEIARLVLTADV